MANPKWKYVLDGFKGDVFSSSAEIKLRYYVDLGGSGATDPSVIQDALDFLPVGIGDQWPGGTLDGAPNGFNMLPTYPLNKWPAAKGVQQHQLRVAEVHPFTLNNSQKLLVDVVYRSRPRPTVEFDSSLTQKIVGNYLTAKAGGLVGRAQMTVGWTIPSTNPDVPPDLIGFPYPTVPGSDTVLRFGSTVRMSATFYADEWPGGVAALRANFSDCVNSRPFVFDGDTRLWLCSNVAITSPDNGYTNTISASFVYNIDGWDSFQFFTDPITQSEALLSQSVVDALYKTLTGGANVTANGGTGNLPAPYNPAGAGAARFPQHVGVDFRPLALCLATNIPMSGPIQP